MMPYYVSVIGALLPGIFILTLWRKNVKGMRIIVYMAAVATLLLVISPFARQAWLEAILGFAWLVYFYAIMALLEKGVVGATKERPPGRLRRLATKHPRLSTPIMSGSVNCIFIAVIGFMVMKVVAQSIFRVRRSVSMRATAVTTR